MIYVPDDIRHLTLTKEYRRASLNFSHGHSNRQLRTIPFTNKSRWQTCPGLDTPLYTDCNISQYDRLGWWSVVVFVGMCIDAYIDLHDITRTHWQHRCIDAISCIVRPFAGSTVDGYIPFICKHTTRSRKNIYCRVVTISNCI